MDEITPVLRSQGRLRSVPLKLFLALSLNVVIAPAVLAASGGTISRVNAYAIGLLGLVTLGLAIYLMMVMLQPERF
ncbi:MAG: K(+)-transporting ATPase subunit F [Stigonema ocellatum SAG 48.90 = DSM 106950]|nr:K(+)-transporting ATPase subunit F [Stigonema ocellatum SAG 48.90 = DSM 106950]